MSPTTPGNLPVDRHDLEMFKTWIEAEFKNIETRIVGVEKGISTAALEQEKRDEQLNDVRLRFLPRPEFESFVDGFTKRGRAFITTFVVMGLTIVELGLTVINMLLTRTP